MNGVFKKKDMRIFVTTELFIERAKEKHGDKFDYSKVNYVKQYEKVILICPVHGEFLMEPRNHLRCNSGCYECKSTLKLSNKQWIEKAKNRHNDKYDYSLSEYVNNKTKIKIICPEHGEFEQMPITHINGGNCRSCINLNQTKNNDTFINNAISIHGNVYNYSLSKYVNNKTKLKIVCSIHGEFEQTPQSHLSGSGCLKCNILKQTKTNADFINESKLIFGDKFDYSLVDYVNNETKVKLSCKKHGEFEATPNNHLSKSQQCIKCAFIKTKPEKEIFTYIKSLIDIGIVSNDRKILNGKELDIYIPSRKIAIEYNGLYWHSESFKTNKYHINKTDQCEKQGVQLIQIFEDEWLHKQDIVKSRLKHIFGLTENKIYGRKCVIKEVITSNAKLFLENNHIQGNVNSKIKLGLYYEDELVSLMTFGGLRASLGQKSTEGNYELVRFTNKLNTTVIGGADKLLKHFIKINQPKQIISYADRRWSQGGVYEKLGFEFAHNSPPNYFYLVKNKREGRFKYRKDILVNEGFDPNKTEHQIMSERKIYRIYDCGCKKYILNLNQ